VNITPAVRKMLACPRTHQPLVDGPALPAAGRIPITRTGKPGPRFGDAQTSLQTADGRYVYPVVGGFPALLWPEVLTSASEPESVDLDDRHYAEAYAEMDHYNPTALARARDLGGSESYYRAIQAKVANGAATTFPEPLDIWLDAPHDIGAQAEAYRYLAPAAGKVFVQLGGDGRRAVKFLLAGAREGILVTPMLGEAVFAWRLAEAAGVRDRFSCILGVGEEIPLQENTVDALYTPGCLHHMQLESALKEIRRVLSDGGRFCAHEPWRAPLYTMGTWLLGKREFGVFERSKSIFCHPFTPERVAPLSTVFPKHVLERHGPLLRYPMIAMSKFGLRLSLAKMIALAQFDDRIGRTMGVQGLGGSLMIGGEKTASV
jgi:SAM-dependent methyltransferase/uncharacterized protein YbaR (Trm112 family)